MCHRRFGNRQKTTGYDMSRAHVTRRNQIFKTYTSLVGKDASEENKKVNKTVECMHHRTRLTADGRQPLNLIRLAEECLTLMRKVWCYQEYKAESDNYIRWLSLRRTDNARLSFNNLSICKVSTLRALSMFEGVSLANYSEILQTWKKPTISPLEYELPLKFRQAHVLSLRLLSPQAAFSKHSWTISSLWPNSDF